MKAIIALFVLTVALIGLGLSRLQHRVANREDIGIFKVKGCLRDDQLTVTYRYVSNLKGKAVINIVASERADQPVGRQELIDPFENPRKLYAVACPERE